jgi:hypothetical protein
MSKPPREPLPTDPSQRALALVARSRPTANRPRLTDPELEARMVAAESERAVRYAAREDMVDRVERATALVDGSEEGVVSVDLDEEDSTVHHVANLRGAP